MTMRNKWAAYAATALFGGATLAASATANAREVTVTITNTTHALYFTPVLVAAHHGNVDLFEIGEPATPELQAMAEGGDTAGLATQVTDAGGSAFENISGGLLAPGESATVTFHVHRRHGPRRLSLTAMLLPTNDGFVGLDSVRIPHRRGAKRVYNLLGYDAGTEANDEIINGGGAPGVPGIPADPGGNSGTGGSGVASADVNQTVHVHRGNVGDDDLAGGASDLAAGVHRWLNPVARVEVRVH